MSRNSILLPVILMLSSCVTETATDAPCYDGWIVDRDGASTIIESEKEEEFWVSIIPDDENIVCVHKLNKKEKYKIVSESKNFLRTTTIIKEGENYLIIDRGIILD